MLLDLTQLHARHHVERDFAPDAFEPQDPDYRVVAPVSVVMDVEKAGGGVFKVSGTVKARLELECGRCLEPFEIPVDSTFELRYVPATAETAAEPEREIGDDDLATTYYQEGSLDVIDLLREQFQLALPMKPLCSEACKGLCPECGTNLNRAQCDCTHTWEDPRLAALKGLLKPEKEN